MLRRRVNVPVHLASVPELTKHVLAYRGAGSLHTFIRDNRNSGTFKEGSPTLNSGAPRSDSKSDQSDWKKRMQRELLLEADPLGGLAHKDYFRDPSKAYIPQYAPRNFANGGTIAYHRPLYSSEYEESINRRDWIAHDAESLKSAYRDYRRDLRELPSRDARNDRINDFLRSDNLAESMITENQSKNVNDMLRNSTSTSAEKLKQQAIASRLQSANLSAPLQYSATNSKESAFRNYSEKQRQRTRQILAEGMNHVHGLRDKERHFFTVMQRGGRIPFQGYDMDRFAAQQRGTPYGSQQITPNIPPSTMDEAQNTMRDAYKDVIPERESFARRAFLQNTVSDSPKLGEALTQDIVQSLDALRVTNEEKQENEFRSEFGIGRQGPLVQDGGPDKRTLKRHTNDERILNAMLFAANAYRHTPTDEHWNPTIRNSTDHGVGHLLRTKFDVERREGRMSEGKSDLTELSTLHLGVPIQQLIDEYVFRHRNARSERPLDYFKPFPDFRALRLNRMYRDTEGFSLMKQRPEFLEWELFTRYRAHHNQRRELALLHGLEPLPNETVQERDARRLKLDLLCEQTKFDSSRLKVNDDELEVNGETLRQWFGVYMLPSPTVVASVMNADNAAVVLHLQHLPDELGTPDTRENILSARYLNKLLLAEGYQHRLSRGMLSEAYGRAPEPHIQYIQPDEVLRHFDSEDKAIYEEYVKKETDRQLSDWEKASRKRRWVPEKGMYGEVVSQGHPIKVVDLINESTGNRITVSKKKFDSEVHKSSLSNAEGSILIDNTRCKLLPNSERVVVPVSARLESGEILDTTNEMFDSYAPEYAPDTVDLYHHLNYGIARYPYNRGNYIETQDFIWEEQTAKGEEGWSPATHADGLRPGLPVRSRRNHVSSQKISRVAGDYERARIVQYWKQPFFNPEPREVTVEFLSDGSIEQVPLSDLLIWQRQYYGPERTIPDESRRFNPNGVFRYVDVADPNNEKKQKEPHFLDKYQLGDLQSESEEAQNSFRTTKQITEIDSWNRHDNTRAENYRPLSISHRRDYIRGGYMHRYTPWEWIVIQENEQPIIADTMRKDDVGASYYFSLNRYWRYKARPHGYIRHFDNEIRDLLQYVDGITPWKKAQKIRTYWEVRTHHPMPQFNRPEVAMHHNSPALLPAHLWETDKKTGKIKAIKDSVRDYQTKTPLPKWVQL